MKDTILRNDAKEFQIAIETSSEIKKKKKKMKKFQFWISLDVSMIVHV